MAVKQPFARIQVAVQRAGRFLSGMVMPGMGAIIAWGLGNALFGPTGWFPNDSIAKINGLMILYLIPILIGYMGGRMVHGDRGGVIGAVAALGAAASGDSPLLIGAMIAGPGAAWILKRCDRLLEGKVRSGLEMLVNNFSAAVVGVASSWAAYTAIGPSAQMLTAAMAAGCTAMIDAGMLPLVHLLIEPGKILFLNNAIQHGVLNPIAVEQVYDHGKSILFLIESNPGPGLGVVLAYWLAGRGKAKQSAPGVAAAVSLGGLHETYFPFVLQTPKLLLAAIAGGMTGTFVFTMLDTGLAGTPSPGSLIAYMALAPKGEWLPLLCGVLASAIVSLVAAAVLLKLNMTGSGEVTVEKAAVQPYSPEKMEPTAVKQTNESMSEAAVASSAEKTQPAVGKIVFACDAGMGSSAMGASILKRKMKSAEISSTAVVHTAISDIPDDADIVITHRSLTERAKLRKPDAEHISIDDFLKSPEYDQLVNRLK